MSSQSGGEEEEEEEEIALSAWSSLGCMEGSEGPSRRCILAAEASHIYTRVKGCVCVYLLAAVERCMMAYVGIRADSIS